VATGEVTYESLVRIEDLDALASEWDGLVLAMEKPTPFLLHGWVRAWLRHLAGNNGPAIHVARRDGRLVAALPLVVRKRRGLRLASFVGGDHPFVDVLLAPDEGPETVGALATHASKSHDCASLFAISAESTIAQTCAERFRLVPRVCAPSLDLEPGFEQTYRMKYSSRQRRTHARRRAELAKLGTLEFELARTSDELTNALDHAFRLHALRWQGRFDTSEFTAPASVEFHRDIAQSLGAGSVPRILTICLDGHPIAFVYYFVLAKRMFCYRMAFDPAYGRCSPGLLCLLSAIERSTEEGVRTVELLGGTQAYKIDIADRVEQLYGGVGLANGIGGRSYAKALVLGYRLRARLACSPLAQHLYSEHAGPLLKRMGVLGRAGRG
jgi:CelD/BcsL family acetyltransferase involved in cellulose biosynthesis